MENMVIKLVQKLVPTYEKVEWSSIISDSTYSIEFFVTINGERLQCYEMADNDVIDEDLMLFLFDEFAKNYRKSDDFVKGKQNKYKFTAG